MANALFNLFNQPNDLVREFEKFKANFSGDPKAQVQRMLDSGQLSQAQFNRLAQMTNQFMEIIGKS